MAKFEDLYGNAKDPELIATPTSDGLMSKEDKAKLDTISEGAGGYVHPATHPATMITEDSTHRFVTDTEKSTWNAKASTAVVTTSTNGLMSSADKSKLNGIANNANNYVHPTNHAASIITQDTTHRFVSDTQINTWNAKADTDIATTSENGLMSAVDKVKLDGIATGANKYVHPTGAGNNHIPSGGSAGQFLKWSASGVAVWAADNNTTYSPATQTSNGLMTAADKTKLDGIASGANNYVHPASHAATIITQDTTHRFVSDAQISTWNAKASTAVATTSANGLMSSTDKTKLDGIATGANKTVVDSVLSSTSTNPVQNKVINTALAGKAATSHTHTKSQIKDFPASIKNPTAITVQLNGGTTEGTNKFTYDGSAAKTINVTPSGIGAAASSHTHSYSQITGLTASRALVSDTSGKPAVSAVTSTELGYLDGVTSSIQTQLNGKAASSHTHSYSQITGLTASRALVSDTSGKPAVSAVTSTELGYLDGVTSNIQTQLNKITSKLATIEAKLKTAVFIKQ